MDTFGVIRRIIELSESSDSDEDPDLARSIQLSLQPPDRPPTHVEAPAVERPSFIPVYDAPPIHAKPSVPKPRFRPPPVMESPSQPPSLSQIQMPANPPPVFARPPPPVMPRPQPPPSTYLPMNPQIIIYPGVWPPVAEPPSTAVIEDVTEAPDEIRYTGEVVLDAVGSNHESRQANRGAGSSRDRQ